MASFSSDAPAMLGDLKIANRKSVLQVFRNGGVYDAHDIASITGLSRPTVMKCIHFFIDSGILVSKGKGSSTSIGGKRPEQYSLNEHLYYICLSLWPQESRIYLYSINHQQIASKVRTCPLPDTPAAVSRLAVDMVGELLEECSISRSLVQACSVSTSGTVDQQTGTLMFSSHNPEWGNQVHIMDDLRTMFGTETPLFLENAGKMCARPHLSSPDVRSKRVLVLFSTWGLSGCLIERGHILSGRNALIGEIGHMIIDPSDPEPCGCGSCGCFERLVSASRVNHMLQEAIASTDSELPDHAISIPELFDLSRAQNPAARQVIRQLCVSFARALRNISLVFDPDIIILQGDYASADSFFVEELRRLMSNFRYLSNPHPFDLRLDTRPLPELDAEGGFIALDHLFFDHGDRYSESASEPAIND